MRKKLKILRIIASVLFFIALCCFVLMVGFEKTDLEELICQIVFVFSIIFSIIIYSFINYIYKNDSMFKLEKFGEINYARFIDYEEININYYKVRVYAYIQSKRRNMVLIDEILMTDLSYKLNDLVMIKYLDGKFLIVKKVNGIDECSKDSVKYLKDEIDPNLLYLYK